MRKIGSTAIRNVGVFGHQGNGKTSLTEAMMFESGAIDRLGRVDDGSASTDFDAEEIKRKISINLGVAHCEWLDSHINLVDAPGYLDFVGDVRAALRVVEIAVLVARATGDVEVGFEIAWDLADKAGVSKAVFINKMDRENSDFYQTIKRLRERYGTCIAPMEVPVGTAETFVGVVDLIHNQAKIGTGKTLAVGEIPLDLQDVVSEYHEMLVESAAEGDDELLEKYLDGAELTAEEVVRGLHSGIDAGKVVPVFCGSAGKGIGIAALLDAIVEAFPNPTEKGVPKGKNPQSGVEEVREATETTPASALVFKTIADPFVGQLTYFRVMSGSVKSDSRILNAVKNREERIGQVYRIRGKQQEAVSEIGAGDIWAVAKLSDTSTGDTLCDAAHPIILDPIEFPKPVYEQAIVARTKVDEDKMGPALQRLLAEDPTFNYRRDSETGQTVIAGMGETHLNIVVERLRRFGANVDIAPVRVPYRETVTHKAEGQGKHKKQTGGRGQYGDCWIRMEPKEHSSGFEFVDAIVGGAIPRQYIPAVEKGVLEAMSTGIQAGYPVVDVKVTCYDGSYHDVDSSEQAFKMAGILAFNSVAAKAGPVILEPIVSVSVYVPDDMMGDVISDLNGKRGRILGMEPQGNGRQCVKAMVPLAEMQRYAIDLRSITRGYGSFEIEPSHYEEAPPMVAQALIETYKKHREAGEH